MYKGMVVGDRKQLEIIALAASQSCGEVQSIYTLLLWFMMSPLNPLMALYPCNFQLPSIFSVYNSITHCVAISHTHKYTY